MIVEYVKGNAISLFLDGKYGMFAHGCNIFNRMGSGIAKEVRERIPELWEIDRKTSEGDRSKLGTISGIPVGEGVAFNMYTQATFWDPNDMLSYDAVRSCFAAVNEMCQETADFGLRPTMCIPKIGAGLARGDWDRIVEIIDEVTPNIDITVVEFDGSK
ncbi:phosphatase [Aeromonas phage GomatiRiver_11]|nr:hypothetical protein OBDJBBDK_00164 [Aeromonas phage AhFM11]WKW84340.1 phosphatase [Aeromonas phage GomatiRiver_11]